MVRPVHWSTNSFTSGLSQSWIPTLYLLSYLVHEKQQNDSHFTPREAADVALRLISVEATKLVLSVTYYYLWKRPRVSWRYGNGRGSTIEEEQPLERVDGFYEHATDEIPVSYNDFSRRSHRGTRRISRKLSVGLVMSLAVIYTGHIYTLSLAGQLHGPITSYLAVSVSSLFTIIGLYSLFSFHLSSTQFLSTFVQICGFLIVQASIVTNAGEIPVHSLLYTLSISTSLMLMLISYIYRTEHHFSLASLHALLFATSLLLNLIIFLIRRPGVVPSSLPRTIPPLPALLSLFFQVVWGLSALLVIYYLDAVTLTVLTSLGAALHLLFVSLSSGLQPLYLLAGCFITITASIMYLVAWGTNNEDDESWLKSGALRTILQRSGIVLLSILSLYALAELRKDTPQLHFPKTKSPRIADVLSDSLCHRRPLPSTSWYPHERLYHKFDNVLLVVFFSHARYDVNVDSYKEVYSEFFPNIVFVGPRSREDAGFNHSYDVLVDSYQSDEDLNDPTFFKMAGRMAHHMLFTALKAHPCYDGYLWVPFDTFLNIPRLQQFDQNLFWYHSPFGKYVYNPALGDQEANANKSRHAPPANISPDPSLNLTASYRGLQDWWWGEPHVGVDVCMPAFRKVPLPMRENLASLTNGTTRLIGGSSDTVYIPGRHSEKFKEVLGLFLETNCFLEIATPTTLHLVVPPGETIQYVDHYWIWQPPFNASFVRQKWAEGLEVDTFHTFHWGEKAEDGAFKGNPPNIPDVRKLLAESAERQGIEFPIRELS